MKSSLAAPSLTNIPSAEAEHKASEESAVAATSILHLCLELLNAEQRFAEQLTKLFSDIGHANVFQPAAATSLSEQISAFKRRRDELTEARRDCQMALAKYLNRPASAVKMSALEGALPADLRALLRQRRLQVISQMEHAQRLLHRTDILLTTRSCLFSEVIAALTGQSVFSSCYGSNGRRERPMSISILEAVS